MWLELLFLRGRCCWGLIFIVFWGGGVCLIIDRRLVIVVLGFRIWGLVIEEVEEEVDVGLVFFLISWFLIGVLLGFRWRFCMDVRVTECLVVLGLIGVEEYRMFLGWNIDGVVSGMFISMLLVVLVFIFEEDLRRSFFILEIIDI